MFMIFELEGKTVAKPNNDVKLNWTLISAKRVWVWKIYEIFKWEIT